MSTDTQSRKWLLTINNPVTQGFDHNIIKEKIIELKQVVYWCMADETGENGTYHTHIYLCFPGGVRFSRIKKLFPVAHIDMARGTSQENRDYVAKEGKWKKDKKKETSVEGTFEENGDCPIERQGARTDLTDLYDLICDGRNNCEIYEENPEFIRFHSMIEAVRQEKRADIYRNQYRMLDVTYIWGATGVGKTRGILDEHGICNVYRVTDYEHPFDWYQGEDVIVFDEFYSKLRIGDMLNYLDIYPIKLPARYINKQACYTKVYIVSNDPLKAQYKNIQEEQPNVWLAFLRRIHKLYLYTASGKTEHDIKRHIGGLPSEKESDWVKQIELGDELPF